LIFASELGWKISVIWLLGTSIKILKKDVRRRKYNEKAFVMSGFSILVTIATFENSKV